MAKRQKEMARQEKQREKAAKRVQRAIERNNPTPEPTVEELALAPESAEASVPVVPGLSPP